MKLYAAGAMFMALSPLSSSAFNSPNKHRFSNIQPAFSLYRPVSQAQKTMAEPAVSLRHKPYLTALKAAKDENEREHTQAFEKDVERLKQVLKSRYIKTGNEDFLEHLGERGLDDKARAMAEDWHTNIYKPRVTVLSRARNGLEATARIGLAVVGFVTEPMFRPLAVGNVIDLLKDCFNDESIRRSTSVRALNPSPDQILDFSVGLELMGGPFDRISPKEIDEIIEGLLKEDIKVGEFAVRLLRLDERH